MNSRNILFIGWYLDFLEFYDVACLLGSFNENKNTLYKKTAYKINNKQQQCITKSIVLQMCLEELYKHILESDKGTLNIHKQKNFKEK